MSDRYATITRISTNGDFAFSLYSDEYVPAFMDNVVTALHSYFEHLLKSLNQEEALSYLNGDLRHPSSEKPSGVRIVEKTIGDFLGALMLFVSVKKASSHLLTEMWVKSLLEVLHVSDEGVPRVNALRPKLLAVKLLATVLPSDEFYGVSKSSYIHVYDSEYKQQVM